ncbi:MAG TPA: acylneuraminate cytidylyltransferase family protein [Polyangiaceae bacterium]|nr:acylneuraminate cytidylyltransferase family protein [Polyangiaceae bacterium]
MTTRPSKPEVLALIPARGGSKSVPRKNLLGIAGKPLIAYSIEHALGTSAITRTIVSTDDPEIARVAGEFGAEVPFLRPAEFATDTATDLQVFRHALQWLEREQGYRPELVVHLRPTGPIRETARIARAVQGMLDQPEADALRSVSLAEQTPYKMWKIQAGRLAPLIPLPEFPEAHSMPRQGLPKAYWQNGYVDVVRPRTVLELDSMVGRVVLPFVIEGEIHELDYPDQIPALERAVAAFTRGELPLTASGERHSS